MTSFLRPEANHGRAGHSSSRSSFFVCERLNGGQNQRVAVVRPELVALTGNPLIAIVLNQLLYWTERLPDFEKLVEEESSGGASKEYGWFHKTAKELIDETFLCLSRYTLRNYLQFLINEGWVSERENPQYKWNKTTQYRVNIQALQRDLLNLGFRFSCLPQSHHEAQNQEKSRMLKISPSKENSSTFECGKSQQSNVENLPFIYLTEITTETTNKEHATCTRGISNLMVDMWRRLINPEGVTLTTQRKARLESLLKTYFQSDLKLWEKFCNRIKASPFLMGKGERGWKVTLDWILKDENLHKVQEGNFDDPDLITERLEKLNKPSPAEIEKILSSIVDPVWKKWCTHFSQGIPLNEKRFITDPISLLDLENIANACFLELEDEKLIWIGSPDTRVLSHIEDLRLILSSHFIRIYPHFRALRTRLITETKQTTTERTKSC